jgi:hypothetical protein
VYIKINIDEQTGERLQRLAKARRTSRNALVREALAHLVKQGSGGQWPQEVLDFRGVPKARRLEEARRQFAAPRKDVPLA